MLVGGYIYLRNLMYDKGFFKSAAFNLPLICIGNLSVGGTGKSPMTEYLLRLLADKYPIAVLSRGYKRKSKGYLLAQPGSTALELGDEPMQFHKKFPRVAIAVGEERIEAIPQLLQDRPDTKVVILDDAFQHRAIKAGFNIVLTDYANPYWYDTYLPTGDLRDNRSSAKRADVIIVTKCPEDLVEEKKKACIKNISPDSTQQVYFTTIEYGRPYHIHHYTPFHLHKEVEIILVCGIANPLPLKKQIEAHAGAYFETTFDDHHIFSIDDWKDIVEKFNRLDSPNKIILTTEKDAVRLEKFGDILKDYPVFVMPIKHRFLFGEAQQFEQRIIDFIKHFTFTPSD
jgi:tetraacyldisaccharide 4'-kinase